MSGTMTNASYKAKEDCCFKKRKLRIEYYSCNIEGKVEWDKKIYI